MAWDKLAPAHGQVPVDGEQAWRGTLTLPPSRDTGRDALIAQRLADFLHLVVRAAPLQVAQPRLERDVVAQGGQCPEEQCLLAPLGQAGGQTGGAACRDRRQAPLSGVVWDLFEVLKARQHSRR